MDILNERPIYMNFDDYKAHLKVQKNWIKNKKRGSLYYVASEIYYDEKDKYQLFGFVQNYKPFVGNTKHLTVPV